ncbi:hypothetical protein ACP70R_047327 [Stipagrostis hirtigluma subsp. patula]
MAEPVVEGVQGPAEADGAQGARPALRWTELMSGFILRRFCDLVREGVKTDKGFKEVHLNTVARALTEFCGIEVSGQQVYNHLRKWRARWVKVCKLKDLSGSLWDEDNMMITLEEKHYVGHVKAHPKDAEFLNKPIINYLNMQTIFGSGVATGRFAMGSNEPLGRPVEVEKPIDLDGDETVESPPKGNPAASTEVKSKGDAATLGKRKRVTVGDDEISFMTGMTNAVVDVAAAMRELAHCDVSPGVYQACMGCTGYGYSREALMVALGFLTDNKAQGLIFV